jgi:hypothetical protein
MKYSVYFKKPGEEKRIRIYTITANKDVDHKGWTHGFSIAFNAEGMLLVPPVGKGQTVLVEAGNTLIIKVDK